MCLGKILGNVAAFFDTSTKCIDAELEVLLQDRNFRIYLHNQIINNKYFQVHEVKIPEEKSKDDYFQNSGIKRYNQFGN